MKYRKMKNRALIKFERKECITFVNNLVKNFN